MATKKAVSTKAKERKTGAAHKRNPAGVMKAGSDDSFKSAKDNGDLKSERTPRRKRTPATLPEESEEIRRANELLLHVWENIYAKRDRFGKFE